MNSWSFLETHHQLHQRRSDASPHTSYLFEFLKNNPRRQRPGERLSSIAEIRTPSIQKKSRNRLSLERARSIALGSPLSTASRESLGQPESGAIQQPGLGKGTPADRCGSRGCSQGERRPLPSRLGHIRVVALKLVWAPEAGTPAMTDISVKRRPAPASASAAGGAPFGATTTM
jgi:hypothetical protein